MAKTFIARKPYSYIPINSKYRKNPSKHNAEEYYCNNYDEQGKQILHTGVLSCTLEVVTPLAVPDVQGTDPEKHNVYDFYMVNGELTVPGSSLRGVLRSVYEAVTESCYSLVNKEDTQTTDEKDKEEISKMLAKLDRCTSRSAVCDACLLFGMIGGEGDKSKALGSRIRVSDAHINIDDNGDLPNPESETLKELYQPQCSVQKDEAGNITGFSGRKMYWNKENVCSGDYCGKETEKNITTGILKPQNPIRFTFQIYYDGIKEDQLEKLIWVISLGQNKLPGELEEKEELLCHKIGRGKPLGLGSVKIKIDKNMERIWTSGVYQIKEIPIEIKNHESEAFKKVKNASYMRPHFSAVVESELEPRGNFAQYKICIQGVPEFEKKKCILSVYKNKHYKRNDKVDVILYREEAKKATFNCP